MNISDCEHLGNQHNNGPHQDHVFDNPSAPCLALWARKLDSAQGAGVGGGGELMHPIGSL